MRWIGLAEDPCMHDIQARACVTSSIRDLTMTNEIVGQVWAAWSMGALLKAVCKAVEGCLKRQPSFPSQCGSVHRQNYRHDFCHVLHVARGAWKLVRLWLSSAFTAFWLHTNPQHFVNRIGRLIEASDHHASVCQVCQPQQLSQQIWKPWHKHSIK